MNTKPDVKEQVKQFMGALLLAGVVPPQVSLEGYRYALSLLKERDDSMMSAAIVAECAANDLGISINQMRA